MSCLIALSLYKPLNVLDTLCHVLRTMYQVLLKYSSIVWFVAQVSLASRCDRVVLHAGQAGGEHWQGEVEGGEIKGTGVAPWERH